MYTSLLTNKINTTLYIGVTNNLQTRVEQHKGKINPGFTSRYNCNKLVYFEEYQWIYEAIVREKQLKGGLRKKKIDLVTTHNPAWNDLSEAD